MKAESRSEMGEFVTCLWYVCLRYTAGVAWVIKKMEQLLTQCKVVVWKANKSGFFFLEFF